MNNFSNKNHQSIILCGGQSTRMKRAKARLPFGPETMLARVVRLVMHRAGQVVVVAAPRQHLPALPTGVEVVRDPVSGEGPLRGFHTGLRALAGDGPVFLTGCDVPLLQPDLMGLLLRLMGQAQAAVPRVDGFFHPLAGLYRPSVLPAVTQLLDRGERRFQRLFDHIDVVPVGVDALKRVDDGLGCLQNVNTPEAYRAALLAAGFRP